MALAIARRLRRLLLLRRGVLLYLLGGLIQLLAILLYILPLPDGFRAAKLTVLVVAVALTVLTGADYSLRARGLARAAEPSRAEEHGGREG